MSLSRLNDFTPGTTIISGDVDNEFNQLVNALNGTSTDKDILMKLNHATNPVLNLNQVGAGPILRGQLNASDRCRIANDGLFEYMTAAGQFAGKTTQYTSVGAGTAISNTTTETSILAGATASSGSSLTVKGNTVRSGTVFSFKINGSFTTTGTPTGRFRVKYGSVTAVDTTAFNMPTGVGAGNFLIDFDMFIASPGAAAFIICRYSKFEFISGSSGVLTPTFAYAAGFNNADTTADAALDVTFQFGTASASNTLQLLDARIDRAR